MIKHLDPDVVGQIAAGEVIERPANLLKELLENSLDAKASQIEVRVSEGGCSISIKDNGAGIPADQLELAVLRHTTSKIRQTEDLWNLSTYGFRGEALASAAAVSQLRLLSRTQDQEYGQELCLDFGKKLSCNAKAAEVGTWLQIDGLFDNLPARKKFLRSSSTEIAQMKLVCKAIALSHPQVEFRFYDKNELKFYFAAVENQKLRAEQILEIPNLISASTKYLWGSIEVYFSNPDHRERNSKNIWIFAQDRWIQDRALQTAFLESQRNFMMHGQYPAGVILVQINPQDIDVNIHPTKSQVKFKDPQILFQSIYHTTRNALEKHLQGNSVAAVPVPEFRGQRSDFREQSSAQAAGRGPQIAGSGDSQQSLNFPELQRTQYQQKNFDPPQSIPENRPDNAFDNNTHENKSEDLQAFKFWSDLQIIGQADLTYLVCQSKDGLIMVDQHAAHERIVFEKLMKAFAQGQVPIQDFLFPLALDMASEKLEALFSIEQSLLQIGIRIEALGPQTLGILSGPTWISDRAYGPCLMKSADEIIDRGGSFQMEKYIADLCASMACHSVVRAGQALSLEEMKNLLKEMDDFPESKYCPHGRPVSFKQSWYEIEKSFGRRG